jgi:hypothetical protein
LEGSCEKEVLYRGKEERNILHTIKRKKANWIGYMLRRNFLLELVVEEKIEGTGRLGMKHEQLLNDFKEIRRCWKLKGEVLDRTIRRTCFGRGSVPVVRQNI